MSLFLPSHLKLFLNFTFWSNNYVDTLFGLCELYCTLLCCRDDKMDCKVHYLSLCLHCEYKEREDPYQVSWVTLTVWCSMQPVSSPCQAAETVTARPRTSCTLQTCSVVKIPRVTQKDFWTIEDFRDLRDEGPATLSVCLCQVYEHWANLIRVYNICNLGEVWPPALTGVSQVIWRPAQPQPVFMIHDDYRSSWLLRLNSFLKLPMWVRIQQDAGGLRKGETVRAI